MAAQSAKRLELPCLASSGGSREGGLSRQSSAHRIASPESLGRQFRARARPDERRAARGDSTFVAPDRAWSVITELRRNPAGAGSQQTTCGVNGALAALQPGLFEHGRPQPSRAPRVAPRVPPRARRTALGNRSRLASSAPPRQELRAPRRIPGGEQAYGRSIGEYRVVGGTG